MKTSSVLGIFTGLALVNPFASALQAMALNYPGSPQGGTETCTIVNPAGGRTTAQMNVVYTGPGEAITLDGETLRPLGNARYVDGRGNQFKQERSMNHLVLSAGGGQITCTLNSQGF